MYKLKRNNDGSVTLSGIGAVSGIYDYPAKNKKELVTNEVLANEYSLKGAIGLPITTEHDNEKVGIIEHATFMNDAVYVDFRVTGEEVIKLIEAGELTELSFRHKSEDTPVTGREYTHIQGVRDYEHLTLTKVARGGRRCSILLDKTEGN